MRNDFDDQPSRSGGNATWWLEKNQEERCRQAEAVANDMITRWQTRTYTMARLLRAYRSRVNVGYVPMNAFLQTLSSNGVLSLNVIRAVINTMAARVGKNKPKVMYLTKGGDSRARKKARSYEEFTDGSFMKSKTRQRTAKALLHTLVFGTGCVKSYVDEGEICDDVVLPTNILIDPVDGAGGDPRQLHEIYHVDKGRLQEMFPKRAIEIGQLQPLEDRQEELEKYHLNYDSGMSEWSRKLRVMASYHLPSSKRSKDGMLCLSVQGVPLSCQQYSRCRYPHSFLRWQDDPVDFWGAGLAEELLGIQAEINRTLRKIQVAIQRLAVPYVLADQAARVKHEQMNGVPGSIINYVGREPRVVTWQAVHPELFAHLDRLYLKAFEISGVAQASAQGAPQATRSGRAALVEDDKQTVRFSNFEEAWEQFHLDIADMHIKLAASEDCKDYKVAAKVNNALKEVKASELDLEEDEWLIQRWPASLMPETPAGRIQMLEQLYNILGDQIPPVEFIRMLDAPDVEKYTSRATAPARVVERLIDMALEQGKVGRVTPEMALDLLLKNGNEAYNEAWDNGEDPDGPNMEALRKLMAQATDMKVRAEQEMQAKQAAAAQASAMTMPGAAPMADPAMPDPRQAQAGPEGVAPGMGAGGAPTAPQMM